MECKKIIKHLSKYVDNLCSSKEKNDISNHLAECESCESLFRILQSTDKLVTKALNNFDPEIHIKDKVISLIENQGKKNQQSRASEEKNPTFVFALFAASIILIFAVIYLIIEKEQKTSPPNDSGNPVSTNISGFVKNTEGEN